MIPWATKRVNKISAKQKVKLGELAEVRAGWWNNHLTSGKPLTCGICNEPILRFSDLANDHIQPGGFGWRNHAESNLQPAHKICNIEKASVRNYKGKTKTVPRKPGRAMTKPEIEAYLKSLKCFCGNEKGNERPCCLTCHARLSPQLRLDLARTGAEKPTFKEYVEILREVELQILREFVA